MSRTRLRLWLTSFLLLAAIGQMRAADHVDEGFEPLLNGRDLKNWSGDSEVWSVEDGVLIGRAGPKTKEGSRRLVWTGAPLIDFELRFSYRLPAGRLEVAYRQPKSDSNEARDPGYLLPLTQDDGSTGVLLEGHDRRVLADLGQRTKIATEGSVEVIGSAGGGDPFEPAPREGWKSASIVARQDRLIHRVNGGFTIDAADGRIAGSELSGGLSIALAGDEARIEIADMRVRRLSSPERRDEHVPRIAAIVTEYRHNSHADVIVTRLLESDTLDGYGPYPKLKLVSLYTDQVPQSDTSRALARKHAVPIFDTVAGALTLGTGELAVDGVLLIAEHGQYPFSDTGAHMYPKRRLFTAVADVFEKSGRSVPVFIDKHLADNWTEAKFIYDTAERLKIPVMAGSSLPVLWRIPAADVPRDAKIDEVVALSYGDIDAYGFHALEMVQCLVERRSGGETGVRWVQTFTGQDVWEAGRKGVYDEKLLMAALSRTKSEPLPTMADLERTTNEPVLYVVEYVDGLRLSVFTLPPIVGEWTVAWREQGSDAIESTLFKTQEARPFAHFGLLLEACRKMFESGEATYPVERTLVTSGTLDALLISKRDASRRVETPYLGIRYQSRWNWEPPAPAPPGRPIANP